MFPEMKNIMHDLSDYDAVKLKEIVGVYGQVLSIFPMSERKFLVGYRREEDALRASHGLRCEMYGFSSIIISLPPKADGDDSGQTTV